MDTYIVTASRDGKFWLLEIDGPGLKRSGATQVRRLDQAEAMVRDWLATRFDLLDDALVKVIINPVLPREGHSAVEVVLAKRLAAEKAQREAQEATTAAAKALSQQDLTTRDIGVLLGVSHQRVSQMVNDHKPRVVEARRGNRRPDSVESGRSMSGGKFRKNVTVTKRTRDSIDI